MDFVDRVNLKIYNHNLIYKGLPPNVHIKPKSKEQEQDYDFGDYLCIKCNFIIYFANSEYYIVKYDSINKIELIERCNLSCEENLVKNIIE